MRTSRSAQQEPYPLAQSALTSSCDALLTVGEVAEILKVPLSWVYERTRRRGIEQIPHFKVGKYVRFSRDEVLEWVHRQR